MAFCQNCGSPVSGDVCQNCGQAVTPVEALTQQEAQSMPGQEPKGSGGKIAAIVALVVIIIVILAAMLFMFPASKDSNGGPEENYAVTMTDVKTMEVHISGEFTDDTAEVVREVIDEKFGDEDDRVTSDEIRDFEEEYGDMEDEHSKGFTMNSDEGKYSEVSIILRGAQGDTNSENTIPFTITATIEWKSLETDKDFYFIMLPLYSIFENNMFKYDNIEKFKFTAPSGYDVHDIDGLKEDIQSGQTPVTGTVDDDFEYIYISLSKKDSSVKPGDITVDMTGTDMIKLYVKGEETGDDAEAGREEIDNYYGNGDDTVTPEEVENYIEYTEERRVSSYYDASSGYEIDFNTGEYSEYSLSFFGAEGDVKSSRPIAYAIAATIEWDSINTTKDFYIIGISASDQGGEQFTYISPSGYEIVRVDKLVEDVASGATSASGTIEDDAVNVYVTIVKKGSDAGSADSEPNGGTDTANSVSSGDEICGGLEEDNDDDDYYKIDLNHYDYLTVYLNGPDEANFDLRLYRPNGDEVRSSTGSGSSETVWDYISSSEPEGNYFIRVECYEGSGPYTLEIIVS
ncbi:MAG: zinc ribbon domain-containing protein [Thermoplasmata archaeon]|nr:MAG: zinc ribbon domain-containing protein [Thermoplasmata archaeon]